MTNMKKTPFEFEGYLKSVHAEEYMGLDDEMGDDFDNWLVEMDVDDWIEYGNKAVIEAIQGTEPKNVLDPMFSVDDKTPKEQIDNLIKQHD